MCLHVASSEKSNFDEFIRRELKAQMKNKGLESIKERESDYRGH
jgi:hypothetical protein